MDQIIKEVIAGIQKKAIDKGAENMVKRTLMRCEAGTARRLKMKKRRKGGENGTTWQHSWMKSNNWRTSWNKEGWKEALGSFEVIRRVPELVVHERMSQGKKVKGRKEEKKSGWSMEEV